MPPKARAGGASTDGRKVGGPTFNQTVLPFGRSPTKTKLKTPENSPDDSPATVKRRRKVLAGKNEELCEEKEGITKANITDTGIAGGKNEAAGLENGHGDDSQKQKCVGAGAADEYFDEEMDSKTEGNDKEEKSEKDNGIVGRTKRGAAVEKQEADEPVGKRQKGNSGEEAADGCKAAPPQANGDGGENGTSEAEKDGSGKDKKKGAAGKVPEAGTKKNAKGGRAAGKKGAKAKAQPAEEPDVDVEVEDEGPVLTLEAAVVGGRCKAYDPRDRKSYTAKILKVDRKEQEAFIHYLGWPSKWDQWYGISELKAIIPEEKEVEIPVPQLVLKSVTATSAVLEAVVPEGSPQCVSYQVSLDDEESATFPFPSDTDLTFTQKLPPGTTLTLKIRLKGKARQFEANKWSKWSEAIEVTTPEEEKVEDDGERGAKKVGEGCYQVSATVTLTEEQKAAKAEKRAVQFHDSHCGICYGWGEPERQLICCDGDCRRSFHASCVNMDEGEIANGEEWKCNGCIKGVLQCLLCQCPAPAEEMVRCALHSCKQHFHPHCLLKFGYEYSPDNKSFRCAQHTCVACKQAATLQGFCAKYIKCVLCPDGYHDKCMPNVGHELFPDLVPNRMVCSKHTEELTVLRKLKAQCSLEDDQINAGPVVMPSHPVFGSLVTQLAQQLSTRFRLPLQYAGARNYEGSKPAPFKLLQRNFYAMGRPKICKEDISICACTTSGEQKCSSIPASMASKIPPGCGDNCENRLTCVECLATTCRLGAQCGNQRLQKRAYARLDLFKTLGRGFGLKALERIPAGALVQEYVGEVLAVRDFQARASRYNENTPVYFFNLDNDFVIDASAMGSMARFINHSCGPNCHTEKWTIGNETRIGIFATEDIEAGQEVTYNYQFESFGNTRHKCLCGAPNCSGELGKRPKSAKDLEAEQAASKKKKGKKKKGALVAVAEPEQALPEPVAVDPAEKMQGRLVRVLRGRGAAMAAAQAEKAAAAAAQAEKGAADGEDVQMGEAEAAGSDVAPGGQQAPLASTAQDVEAGNVEEGETGEVLALEGELALVRKASAEALLRMWRVTSDVLRAMEKDKAEKKREREAMMEDENADVVTKRGEKDPLAGLAPVLMDVDVEWVPLGDIVTTEQEEDACDDDAAGEASKVKEEGTDSELVSPSKAARGVGEKSMRITKVTDERVAEMMTRPLTVVKVQPQDGSLHARDMAKLCEGLKTHPSVVRLDLDSALIGDEGCRELATVIAESKTLQSIDLQFNGITDVGAKVLAQAISEAKATPSIRDLHLGRNNITNASVCELEKALHRSPLLNLLLSGNKLSSVELDTIQQWHLTTGDIRGLLVDCDASRRKRKEQRMAALKAEEEEEEEEEEGDEEKASGTQGEEVLEGEGGQVEGGSVVKDEGSVVKDEGSGPTDVKREEVGAETKHGIADTKPEMPCDAGIAAEETGQGAPASGPGEASEEAAQKGE